MKEKPFSKIRFKDIFFILFIIIGMALITHFYLIDRVGFWRLVYPLQAQLAIWNIHCSKDSPVWMQHSVKYIIKNQRTLGNQLAYIDQNNQLHTCQSGWQKTTLFSTAISKDTRFRYASMTKIITNDAIIDLVNQGKIHLDDKMVDFFSELKNQDFKDERIKNISIANLLQQRSGFDRMQSEDVVFATHKKSWCPTEIKHLTRQKLDFEPNARYAYDNRNTCLLGAVIERITHQPYRDYIQQQYQISKNNIKFVDGVYYPDEVKYDFRNNNFWMESDDNSFDFQVISSSAGLSGSAKSLAQTIKPMLQEQPLNILGIAEDNLKNCEINQFKSCNGYAMWQYQQDQNSPKMYFRNGGLPAATSLAMVTENKELIVWTSNGATPYYAKIDENVLEKYFYKILNTD